MNDVDDNVGLVVITCPGPEIIGKKQGIGCKHKLAYLTLVPR